ncbi:MAG: hypothetical protein AAGB22_04665 [Bacteroidota bacterium]
MKRPSDILQVLIRQQPNGLYGYAISDQRDQLVLEQPGFTSQVRAVEALSSLLVSAVNPFNYQRHCTLDGRHFFMVTNQHGLPMAISESFRTMTARDKAIERLRQTALSAPGLAMAS